MIFRVFTLLLFLSLIEHSTAQQYNVAVTWGGCTESKYTISLADKGTQDVIQHAAIYIASIIGDTIFYRHIKLLPCSSTQTESKAHAQNASDSVFLKKDTIYRLEFEVVEGNEDIGYINISLDRSGNIFKPDVDNGSSPDTPAELIYGFKKYLTHDFKIDYKKANRIALKAGFINAGFLDCEIKNDFTMDSNKNEFAAIRYYWRVVGDFKDGRADAYIDVQTGQIERFWYMPGGMKE